MFSSRQTRLLLMLLLLTGCSATEPFEQPDPGDVDQAPETPPPGDYQQDPGFEPIGLIEPQRELSAWELVTASISADGTVSKDVALQAFALTIGPIPGVEVPGASEIGVTSGTAALRWVTQHAEQLTAEQRAAIEEAMLPMEAGDGNAWFDDSCSETPDVDDPDCQVISRNQQGVDPLPEHGCTEGNPGVSEDGAGAAPYRVIMKSELAKLEQALGRTLDIPVYITLGLAEPGSDTLAWTSTQSNRLCATEPATSCRMQLLINQPKLADDATLRSTISHELLHCFQGTWMPAFDALSQPDWLSEGFPDFAGELLNPTADRSAFRVYTLTPARPLYTREYDAQGFFFHLLTLGADVFNRYPTAFKMKDSSKAFTYLIEPVAESFAETWASVLALEPDRGEAWDMVEAPAYALPFVPTGVLEIGQELKANPGEADTRIAHINFDADVVRFEVGGGMHGRISWDDAHDELISGLNGAAYCRRADGCQCPPGTTGSPPQTPIPSIGAMVSAAGTTEPTTLRIFGVSVDQYCQEVESTPVPPDVTGVDQCIVGTWESSTWTLPGPIADLDLSGGSGAIVTINANGQALWNFDNMQPMIAYDDFIDVTTEMYSRGGATGQIAAVDGLWEVSGLDTSGLEGFAIDNIIGEYTLSAGPGLFVMLQNGNYTCSGNTLSYLTLDPVDNAVINVMLQRK